jgi:hypothetical protein
MSRLAIAFLGQCHTVGYDGVAADRSFPEVCRGVLQAARPEHQVELIVRQYHHPAELPSAAAEALRSGPRVIVVEVVGWLAMVGSNGVDLSRLPRRVRSAYERVRFFRQASRRVALQTQGADLIHIVREGALGVASSLLRPLLARLPRPTIVEYEACVGEALDLIAQQGVPAVVQGPGSGNFAVRGVRLPANAMQLYREVAAMARRVAAAHGARFVDRWDTVAGCDFYLSGSTRPSARGHSVWGHLLADHLLRDGLV